MSDDYEVSAADNMLDGLCCSHCSTFFSQAHGYPVLCKSCWHEHLLECKRRKVFVPYYGLQKAIHAEAGE